MGAQDGSAPAKPTGVVATATHDSVALAWDNPDDASITHYQIFRRDRGVHDTGEFVTIEENTGSAAASYTDANVEPEGSYVYRVKAVNQHGASTWSNFVRADTPAAPDPADLAPSGLVVSLVENRVTLTWDAPASDAASVTGYEILRRRPNDGEAALTTLVADTGNAETGYTDDTANEPGVSYTYRVKALRDGEQSKVSNYARIDLPDDYAQDTPEPEEEPSPEALAPSGLTAAVEDGGVALSWTAPAEDAGSVTGYEVLRAQGSAELTTLEADTGNTDTTYTDSGVTGDLDDYRYQVKALRDGDASQGSNVAGVLQSAHAGAIVPLADVTLISNLGQSSQDGGTFTNDQAQAFTTGSNSGGYSLTKVVIHSLLGLAADFTVSVHENDSGAPGTSLGTLTKPTLPAAGEAGNYEFTHSGIDLAASTTYFIVVDVSTSSASFIIYNTHSDAEDTGGATGWSIGDSSLYRGFGSTGSWTTWAQSKRISITGTVTGGTTNNDATGAPVITGTPEVGELLTADISNIGDADGIADADFEYQWIAFDGTTDSDISGATGETYRPLLAHVGQTIKVRVTFDDDEDNAESLTSAPTATVTASTYGQVIWAATLTVEEETVAAGTFFGYSIGGRGSLEPVGFTYDGVANVVTALQYLEGGVLRFSTNHSLVSGDFNLYVDGAPFLIESPGTTRIFEFSDHGLTWTDEQEVEVRLTVNRPATGAPAITGTPEVGETLTAGISAIMDEDGLPVLGELTYQWISDDGTDDSDIDGATDSTYTLVEADAGKSIKVRVSFTDNAKFPESLTSAAVTVPVAALVSNVGQTAATGDAQVNTPQSQGQGFTTGSDSGGYTLGSVELAVSSFSGTASDITVSIYSESSGDPGTVVHTLTTPASISAAVTTFTAPSGATLAASTTYYVVISTTSSGISLSRTDATAEDTGGVSGWSIADSRRFFGLSGWNTTTNPIRMRVNGDAATSTNSPATGAPTISGTPAVGELLTADISNIGDADGIADADFEYQWIAFDGTTDSDIDGATGETYRPLLAHVGQTIKVRVSFNDDDDNAESLTSAATAAVTASTYGQVIWAATLTVEEETVAAGTFFGFSLISDRGSLEPYTFTHDGNSTTVTALQYLEGGLLRFTLSGNLGSADFNLYLDGAPFLIEPPGTAFEISDHGLSWTDEQEVEVRLTVNRPATGAPAITGKPEVGETLTADASAIEDPDGRPADADLDYQWISDDGTDDSDIDGATDSTYAVVQADEGKTIKVRVSFTDDAKFPESLTSAATTAVTVPVAALVSNVGQTATGNANVTVTQSQGQGFTTGSDSGGYTLGSVELAVSSFSGAASDITVSIYSESSGDPGTVVHTLTTPASISTPVTTFTAPSGTTLAAGTTYYVVISTTGSGINLSRTDATAEDTGGVSGWSIADSGRVFASNAWRTTTSPIRMRVNGAAATTSTGIWSATLTVAIGGSFYGYSGIIDVGDLEPAEFTYNGNPATVQVLAYSGNVFYLQTSPALDSGDYLLTLDDTPIQLGTASGSPLRHRVSDHGLTWTADQQVEVRLALNNAPTGEPVITGTPEVSQTLTADISGIMDTDGLPADDQFSYQWIRSDGATDSDISGATNATYKLGRADLGKTIKVRVTFTDGGGFPERLTSDATGPVTHLTVSSDWSLTPSSLNPGDRFRLMFLTTTRNATPKDIDVYNEWVQGRAAGGHDAIREYAGAFNLLGCTEHDAARDNTGTTYTTDDKGVRIYWLNGPKVVDDYEDLYDGDWDEEAKMRNRGGTERDNPQYVWTGCGHNGAVSSGAWLGHDKPTIGLPDGPETTGGPLSSSLITANAGSLAVYALSDVFEVAVPATDVPVNWSLVPSGLQEGDQFRLLFISSSSRNAAPTSIDTYNTWIQNRVAAGHTDIQGYSSTFNVVGSTADVDARDNTGTTYTSGSSYKGVPIYWLNGNKVVDDYEDFYDGGWDEEASMRTEAGTSIAAPNYVWTGSDDDGTEEFFAGSSLALGKGSVRVGAPNNNSNISEGPLAGTQNFHNSASYKLYGLSGVFRVVAGSNTPATGKPTISGTPEVNQTLTADISSIMDADGLPAAGQFSYQWISDDSDIDGATDSTYILVFADYDNTIKVRVSFTDNANNPESLTSTAVGVASPYGDVIHSALLTVGIGAFFSGYSSNTNTGVLEPANFIHNGNSTTVQVLAYIGNVFHFQTSPALGSGDYALILDDTPIQLGAASGSPARHQVSDHGLTWTADQQVEVWLVLNNEPTGVPVITGTPVVSQTLTADISSIMDADGLPAAGQFSYQWISDDSDIDGATGSTYTLVQADAGKTIKVRVSFTDSSNFPESLTSAATRTVLKAGVIEVPSTWSLIPSGLGVGDEFRLLFVSSTTRNAASTSISTYNTWIQTQAAAGHTDIQDYSDTFRVVGSTADVDARDNTRTTYTSSDKGVPIYWLNGNKVVDQYEDFYDGGWDDEANMKTEDGDSTSPSHVYTGSDDDGTEAFAITDGASRALGVTFVALGKPNQDGAQDGPLYGGGTGRNNSNLPFYGLSGVFRVAHPPPTVVPADWSLIPSGLVAGQEFRLLFLSSTKRSIRSTNISDYNTFVQNRAAAGHTDIQDYSDTFRVLGSTGAKDARDNTGTTYTSSDKGVRIYWLNGDKAADEYQDFYDGSWDQQADAWNESGVEYDLSARRFVATGSSKDGTTDQSNPLGASSGEVQLGCLYQTSSINGPVSCNFTTENISADNNQQLYGLSGVFQVTTNNATGKPTISGTPEVKQTLTADISGIVDTDGLPADDQFSYQWIRSDGTDDSDISGATDSTYKLKAADQGKTIKVRVTFTDGGGTEETLTSDATTAVAADTTGPVVEQVICNDSVCNLLFDELLDVNPDHFPPTNAFAITADGAAISVGGVFPGIQGRTSLTSLAPLIRQGQTVKIVYTDPTSGDDTNAIQDAAGNDAAEFTTGEDGVPAVTNNSTLAPVAPDAPTGLTATDNGATQIDLAWTAPADNGGRVITGYQIEKSDDAGTSWSVLVADTQSTDTIYSDTTLSGGETRHYRVSAINSVGTGAASSSTPTGKPAITGTPEVNKTLTADVSGIVDTDGLPAADQFSYQWVQNDGTDDSDISGATDSTYKLEDADLGKTIKVRVTFTDEGGTEETLTSAATAAVAADTTGPTLTGGAVDRSGFSIDLEFDENLDTDLANLPQPGDFTVTTDGVVGTVENAVLGNAATTFALSVSPRIYQGQTVIVTYDDPTAGNDANALQDAAGNDAADFTTGEDGVPAVTNDSTLAPVAPDAPTGLTATASGGTQIDLAWTAPADNGGRVITGYQIEKSDDAGTSWSVLVADTQSTATMYSDTTLSGGDTRHYRVSAINSIDTGAASTVADATTLSGPGVASVTVDQATITQTSAAVTVTVANLQNASHTVYLRYRVAGGNWPAAANQSTPTSGTAVTFTLSGLTGNTEYDVRASLDSAFASGVKTATFTTSPTKPGKTRSVDVTTSGNGTLFITWQAPDSDGGSAITGYKVQWKSGSQSFGDPSREHTTEDTFPDYLITGLTNGTEYTVRVIAVNAVGDGPPSDTTTGTPEGPPDVPPNVQAGSGHQQLTVSWGAPNDGGSAITEYTLQWKSGGQNFNSTRQRTIAAPSRTDTIPSLINGTEYTVRVRATTALSDSGWSTEAKGTPREGPHVSLVKVKEPISCTVTFVALEFVNLEAATEYQAHLRFRAQGSSSWTVLSPQGFWSSGLPSGAGRGELNGPSPAFTLTDLAYETAYEVQAALDSGFVDGLATTTFSTPNLSEVGLTPLSPGDGTLGLRMTRPTSEGRVDGYVLQWKSGDEEYDDTDTSERQADVPGSGDREYTITGLDNGVEYTVRAMAYNDNGVGVPSSEVRGTPEAPPNSPARGAPTISGTAQVGETLTADTDGIEDDDGLADAVYSYQWLADDADVAGATSDTYTPVADDVGKAIKVKVSFRDDRNHQESLTSAATAAVAEDPDAPTEPPNAPRTVRIVGDTNTSLTLTWDAPDGGTAVTEYRVQWLTVGEGFANARRDGREAVVDASARSHTITGLTKYGFYQVRVLAVNGAGESERSNTAWGFPGLGEGQYGHG